MIVCRICWYHLTQIVYQLLQLFNTHAHTAYLLAKEVLLFF